MMQRDARDDWRGYAAGSIPSKVSTPQLDRFLAEIRGLPAARPLTLLDVGCGTGRLGRRLFDEGFSVVGVDINPEAIGIARELAISAAESGRSLRFEEADFATPTALPIDGGPFDIVVCQLVVSIIGHAAQRLNLLRHVRANLRPGGWFYLSASGVSDTINASYARLYADDAALTGEAHSYFSRDDQGKILYTTHHFTSEELVAMLNGAGFEQVRLSTDQEASSRRPDEAAFFHFVTCRRG